MPVLSAVSGRFRHDGAVPLNGDEIRAVLRTVLARVSECEGAWRLVGTASSVVRGVAIEAADIDVLFRERSTLDLWFQCLSVDAAVDTAPTWLENGAQYFARVRVGPVIVELSTVEIEADGDTMECFGSGPWQHFDTIEVDGHEVTVVANELRLITEIARQRPERYQPLMEHMASSGCDIDLIKRGLPAVGATDDQVDAVIRAVARVPDVAIVRARVASDSSVAAAVGGSGPPVVFEAGSPGDSATWREVTPLVRAFARTIAYNRLGYDPRVAALPTIARLTREREVSGDEFDFDDAVLQCDGLDRPGALDAIPVAVLLAGRPNIPSDYPSWYRQYFADTSWRREFSHLSRRARVTDISDAGHNIPQEAPAAVARAVEWVLAESGRPAAGAASGGG